MKHREETEASGSSDHKLLFTCRLTTVYRIWRLYWRKITPHFLCFLGSFLKHAQFSSIRRQILGWRYLGLLLTALLIMSSSWKKAVILICYQPNWLLNETKNT